MELTKRIKRTVLLTEANKYLSWRFHFFLSPIKQARRCPQLGGGGGGGAFVPWISSNLWHGGTCLVIMSLLHLRACVHVNCDFVPVKCPCNMSARVSAPQVLHILISLAPPVYNKRRKEHCRTASLPRYSSK